MIKKKKYDPSINLTNAGKGRPKGSKNKFGIADLEKAISNIEKKKKIKFWEHVVSRALVNDSVLAKLIDKFIASKNEHTGAGGLPLDFISGIKVEFINGSCQSKVSKTV